MTGTDHEPDHDSDVDPDVTAALFGQAARWFTATVGQIPPQRWDDPGLGTWTVRELVGHTMRTTNTVLEYLVDGDAAATLEVEIDDVIEYFQTGLADPTVHEAIEARGRQAGADLGTDPSAVVEASIDAVCHAIDDASDDAVCTTRFGVMWLPDYLDARIVELVLHTLDLRAACELPLDPPAGAARRTLDILAALVPPGDRGAVLLALAGRRPLPDRFTALG